ncbi:MAG TPA: arginine--tRNA ligase [Burkholderiales bacterium]|nr:arginine--tRNA ligase [Burkholderiales bacterium]
MTSDPKARLAEAYRQALAKEAPDHPELEVVFEKPRQPEHGDFACSIALQLAKRLKRNPRQLAEALTSKAIAAFPDFGRFFAGYEIAGPGFINFRLRPQVKLAAIQAALAAGASWGRASKDKPLAVQVEFVSANPTGPLHVGHGRQAAIGDALAAILEARGDKVTREFYYNDAGAQIHNLALSVQARARGLEPGDTGWPADGYAGEYIEEIGKQYRGNLDDLEAIRKFAVEYLRKEQDIDLREFGVKFDVYYLESSLYTDGKVDEVVKALIASGKAYEKDGALWLHTTEYGDDKDRVIRKSDGTYTYFVPDIAYHLTKWRRGFAKVINVQGTDHMGTKARVRAGLQALNVGVPPGYPDYVMHSMVRVMRGGEEVKISKRAGSYVTLRDLLDWVGRDAVRFFLLSRRADADFVFDIDLARAQTEENPVYYVQYAHARVCSVFAQWKGKPGELSRADLSPLTNEKEFALAQRIGEFPDLVAEAARELSPHSITFYLRSLAAEFHSYYNAERILVDDEALRTARLALCAAVRQTLASGLSLIGVSAPEKM